MSHESNPVQSIGFTVVVLTIFNPPFYNLVLYSSRNSDLEATFCQYWYKPRVLLVGFCYQPWKEYPLDFIRSHPTSFFPFSTAVLPTARWWLVKLDFPLRAVLSTLVHSLWHTFTTSRVSAAIQSSLLFSQHVFYFIYSSHFVIDNGCFQRAYAAA